MNDDAGSIPDSRRNAGEPDGTSPVDGTDPGEARSRAAEGGSPPDRAGSPDGTLSPGRDAPPNAPDPLGRRRFLKQAGAGVGALAAGGSLASGLAACGPLESPGPSPAGSPDVVVIGAGTFGGWTAYNLRRMGARVTLVDAYGPGNSRSTSGDETRGIRSAYGDRELWSEWAKRSIERWKVLDEEWAERFGHRVFFTTGDLILRREWDDQLEASRETFERVGIRYEVLDSDEVAYRWPQISVHDVGVGFYEPDAGVGKSRLTCHIVAESFQRNGGRLVHGHATPGRAAGNRLEEVVVEPGEPLSADLFVFALGPWFPKAFPELMGEKIRIPMGHVYYFGTPPGDDRFSHPNMPSFGIPGGTGWPTLPPNHRGFRFRTGGRAQPDPDTSERWIPEPYVEVAREALAERFPDLADAPLVETRACHYESSPDREWIIDRHPDWENVWFAGAGNAEAFKFGPLLGEYIAGRVMGDDPHPELAERFRRVKDDEDVAEEVR